MKILHILDHSIPLHSGYTFRSRAILREQNNIGIKTVHATSPKQGQCEQIIEEIDGLKFYRSNLPKSLLSKLPIVNQFSIVNELKKTLRAAIKQEKPEILHAHSPALNGLAAIQVAKEFNLPVVYEIRAFWEDAAVDHGTCKEGDLRYKMTRALENYVVAKANKITVICQGLKDDLISRGVSPDKITLIPNAVEVERFAEQQPNHQNIESLKSKLNINNEYVLGFLGSFYAYEGLDLLLDALKIALKTNPNIKLLLVGGGPQEQNLKQQAKEQGLEQQVIFTGRVPHHEIADYYAMVDLLVFPRKSMRLTELVTPLKPLEAMAQHKLVLASDVGGHKELIEHGKTGYLFKAGDISALAAEILRLAQVGNNETVLRYGFEYVKTVRNWKVSVSNYLNIYPELIK